MFPFFSVDGLSFMRSVMKKMNNPTTATVKMMFVVERSKETMFSHAVKDSSARAYRPETHVFTEQGEELSAHK